MSAIKKHISTMSLWKKVIWLTVAIGAPIITAIFTIWSFCLHGTLGLFLWFPVFTYLLIIIVIFDIVVKTSFIKR